MKLRYAESRRYDNDDNNLSTEINYNFNNTRAVLESDKLW